jgi:hypothetical protein
MPDDLLYANGINVATGGPLLPALATGTLARVARGETLTAAELADLYDKRRQVAGGEDSRTHGVLAGIEPNDLRWAGWSILFAAEDAAGLPAMRDALAPLLALRREQAGERYREYDGELAYSPGDSKNGWLSRAGGEPGPVDPTRTPYYLLILASPERIPFRFQYQLDVQYAVGRLWFDGPDALDRYATYAQSVVAAETGQLGGLPWSLARKAAFFGVRNDGDTATGLSAEYLVKPLAAHLAADQPTWQVTTCLNEQADKIGLARLLGGDDTPALLFTASHGIGFPAGHELQRRQQGALLCSDWPGPERWREAIPERFYFSADDVAGDARLLGTIAFHFACYGAGTPRLDDFAHRAGLSAQAQIAPCDFLAGLPQRLLGHPRGGALAVIGHVDRAWGCSFIWDGLSNQLTTFKSTLKCLAEGQRVGFATEYFNERYAELSTMLSAQIEDIKFGAEPDEHDLAGLWTANNDARSYIVIGDPAVRLPLAAI